MKKLLPLLSMALLSTFTANELRAAQLSTDEQKYSYSQGRLYGESIRRAGVKVNLEALKEGIEEAVAGKESQLTNTEMNAIIANTNRKYEEDRQTEYRKRPQLNAEYLAKNAKNKNVITTSTGLQYEIIRPGTGPTPKPENVVRVHYLGKLIDGTEFDSSFKRGEPAEFPLNAVIKGWVEGIQLMKVGGKTRFTIPSHLAYGENGPGLIGPNALLIFEVELLDIVR